MKEAYPNWTKTEARKIRKYLYKILSDAEQYKENKTRRIRSKQGYRVNVTEKEGGTTKQH